MNKNQRKVLIAIIIIVAAMMLFPPFYIRGVNGVVINLGYSFLFKPPIISNSLGSVDTGMLLTQWIGVLIVGGVAFYLLKDKQ